MIANSIYVCFLTLSVCAFCLRFGFSEKKIIPLACVDFASTSFLEKVNGRKELRFWPSSFIRYLSKAWTEGRCKNKSAYGLGEEIQSMLWCVQYFSGFDIARNPSGPPPPVPIKMFLDTEDVKSVIEKVVMQEYEYAPILINEYQQEK